jgi:hypothetical protein
MSWFGRTVGGWLGGWLGSVASAVSTRNDAVSAIIYLLQQDSLTAYGGVVPINSTLPAMLVREIIVTAYNTISVKSIATARVRVTVLAKTYTSQKEMMQLVREACPNQSGTINGAEIDSILPDAEGPDLYDPELNIYMQDQDFMVKFYQ